MWLQHFDICSWQIILLLITAGFVVGVINTFAGNGTVITYSLFLLMGLDPTMANGTPRLGVVMQTLSASFTFRQKKVLDLKKGLILGIPVSLGSIAGAQIAVSINKGLLEMIIAGLMLVMLFFIIYKPERWLRGSVLKPIRRTGFWQVVIFFLIGIYGGFIHIGVGIFLLAALVMNAGYDLVRANALKVFIVLLYSPFALAVFMINGQVHYGLGLIAAIGNFIGGWAASQFAVTWGANFLRWFLVIIIILSATYSFGLYGYLEEMFLK
jgi:uncharacterized protein